MIFSNICSHINVRKFFASWRKNIFYRAFFWLKIQLHSLLSLYPSLRVHQLRPIGVAAFFNYIYVYKCACIYGVYSYILYYIFIFVCISKNAENRQRLPKYRCPVVSIRFPILQCVKDYMQRTGVRAGGIRPTSSLMDILRLQNHLGNNQPTCTIEKKIKKHATMDLPIT